MTLLFYLRSPGGNTDTGRSPDAGAGGYYDPDDSDRPKKGAKKRRELAARAAKALAEQEIEEALALDRAKARKLRKRKEEALLLLFMHEFDGYDD